MEKRYIGKCGGCKKHSSLLASREKEAVKRGKRFVYRFVTAGGEVLYSAEASASLFDLEQACACGRGMVLKPVAGRVVSEKRCDARCQAATGHMCECACGGKHHGASHG